MTYLEIVADGMAHQYTSSDEIRHPFLHVRKARCATQIFLSHARNPCSEIGHLLSWSGRDKRVEQHMTVVIDDRYSRHCRL